MFSLDLTIPSLLQILLHGSIALGVLKAETQEHCLPHIIRHHVLRLPVKANSGRSESEGEIHGRGLIGPCAYGFSRRSVAPFTSFLRKKLPSLRTNYHVLFSSSHHTPSSHNLISSATAASQSTRSLRRSSSFKTTPFNNLDCHYQPTLRHVLRRRLRWLARRRRWWRLRRRRRILQRVRQRIWQRLSTSSR